ncbi:MAG: NUDIX domain-containing protein [Candidatus Zixiibacteriota bacterium]|nr:MAG: NUDIX domain-containing protein [candidate division Zixibacteria bacterium]
MKEKNFPKNLPPGVPIFAPFISAYLISYIEAEARFLIIKRDREPYKNIWQPITGKIREREKAWQAAIRELREETGLTPDRFYSAEFIEKFYELNTEVIALSPAFVGFVDGDPDIKLSHEHREYRWVTVDEAIEKVIFYEQKAAFRHIRQYFIEKQPPEFLKIEI